MSTEDLNTPAPEQKPPRKKGSGNRPAIFAYIVALFAVAFLLLVVSYFMQQRRDDQQLIAGLQQNASALQITQSLQDQVKTLQDQLTETQAKYDQISVSVDALEQQNETLTQQVGDQTQTALALDWLWQIQRDFFQKRYSAAREKIRTFEAAGLLTYLPAQSLVDPEARSPLEQYQAIYDSLF